MSGASISWTRTREWLALQRRRLLQFTRAHPWLALLCVLIAIPCAALFALEVRSLRGEIYDVHEWRQGETFSIAYAFAHEGASFFFPRHAWRGDSTGIVGTEMPIYAYGVSWFMRVVGDSFFVARFVNFALFVIAFSLQLRRITQRLGVPQALGYLVMAAFSPAVLSEFRQMQPDPAMLSFALIAAVYLHDHGEHGRRRDFALGLGFYTLSLLTKPIAIAMMPAMLLFSLCGATRPMRREALVRASWFGLPLALMIAWDRWAHHLVATYMGGYYTISIDHSLEHMWRDFTHLNSRRYILTGLLPNYTSHVSLVPAIMTGLVSSMRPRLRSWGIPYLAWFAGVAVIAGAFSSRYWANWYYMLPFVPPLLFYGALALGSLFEVVTLRVRDPQKLWAAFAVVLGALLITPLLSPLTWEFTGNDAARIAVHARRSISGDAVYWIAVLGGLVGAASLTQLRDLRWSLHHRVLASLLVAGSFYSMWIPYLDVQQSVRFYVKEEMLELGRADRAEIRAAVDRFSTTRDLFVMNGYHPGFLARALRVGWADDPNYIQRVGKEHYVARGARFFMTFADGGRVPPTMQTAQVIARGARWELRCLDPEGCPAVASVGE